MRILHVVSSVQTSVGGPALSVTRLASEQAKLGHEVTLASLHYTHLGHPVAAGGVRTVSLAGGPLAVHGRGWSPEFRRLLAAEARCADLVHNHGLWMWPNAYAREAAVAAGRPLVISPRGMLERWSLNRSRIRKAVAWQLFEKKNLRSAALFHATAESEAENLRGVGCGQAVVVAPNGVDLPDLSQRPARTVLESAFPLLRGRKWISFLSRLHPKKGLGPLLESWSRLAGTTDALLVVAGSDLTGYRGEVERMIQDLNLADRTLLTGDLRGTQKDCLLANAEFFCLPSFSENFGIAIAEAMSWARPVITSTATPWGEVDEAGAGWVVAPESGAIEAALRDALGKTQADLEKMGAAGRAIVATRYEWAPAVSKVTQAYAGLFHP